MSDLSCGNETRQQDSTWWKRDEVNPGTHIQELISKEDVYSQHKVTISLILLCAVSIHSPLLQFILLSCADVVCITYKFEFEFCTNIFFVPPHYMETAHFVD